MNTAISRLAILGLVILSAVSCGDADGNHKPASDAASIEESASARHNLIASQENVVALASRQRDIDDYVRGIPHLPQVAAVAPHSTKPGTPIDQGIINRRRRLCQTDGYSQTTDFEEVAALDPNTASIYPGGLVEGKNLASGRFSEIALPRGPLTLTVTGLPVANASVELSASVNNPSLATVQKATNLIVADPLHVASNSLAKMSLGMGEVHSFDQALLDAGVSASWLSGDVSARLKTVTTSRKHSLLIKFTQVYYEVSATGLPAPSSVFSKDVKLDQVEQVAFAADTASSHPLNPPLYVKSVKYGRMAIISVASDAEESALESAVRTSFNALAASGKFTMDNQSQQILSQSKFDGIVVGGSGSAGVAFLNALGAGDITGLKTFLEAGATYHPQVSPAAAISYTLTYLDNDVADSSFAADFSMTGCTDNAVPIERLKVTWSDGDDNKDQEMYPYVIVRDKSHRVVANTGGEGRTWASAIVNIMGRPVRLNAEWKQNQTYGPFEIGVLGPWSLDQCESAIAEVGQRSSNGEDPEWHNTFEIQMRVNGQWYTIRQNSVDHNEFKLGDGKPDMTPVPLACPAL